MSLSETAMRMWLTPWRPVRRSSTFAFCSATNERSSSRRRSRSRRRSVARSSAYRVAWRSRSASSPSFPSNSFASRCSRAYTAAKSWAMRRACAFACSETRIACWRSWRKISGPFDSLSLCSESAGASSVISTLRPRPVCSAVGRSASTGMSLRGRGEDGPNGVDELQRPEWLREVLRGAGGEADRAIALAVMGGEHDDRDALRLVRGLELAADVESVRAGAHVDVEEHEVGLLGARHVEGLLPVLGLDDRPALRREGDPHHLADRDEVISDQELRHVKRTFHHGHARNDDRTLRGAPPPGGGSSLDFLLTGGRLLTGPGIQGDDPKAGRLRHRLEAG